MRWSRNILLPLHRRLLPLGTLFAIAIDQISSARLELETQVEGCFARRRDYEKFVGRSREFYKGWVRKSHNPRNPTIGIGAGLNGIKVRRAVFYTRLTNLCEGRQGYKAIPRVFKDVAWVDEDCLGEHAR